MHRRLCLLALTLGALTACSVELDERLFWAPHDVAFEDNREGQTGLFMGEAIEAAQDIEFYHRGEWTTRIVFDHRAEDFIPATVQLEPVDSPNAPRVMTARFTHAAPSPDRPLIVHCYGIGANLYNNGIQYALKVLPYGDALQFDLPGHGLSAGTTTVADFAAATDALSQHLESVDPGREIVFWGHSLGGFICAELAQRSDRTAGLVIEATSDDAVAAAKTWVPFLVRPLLRISANDALAAYSMRDILKGFDRPVLVLAGQKDDVIAPRFVNDMAMGLEALGVDVTFVEFRGANHATISFADGFDATMRRFLDRTRKE